MSGGHAVRRAATLAAVGLVTSACASHPEPELRDPGGCALNDLPLASFIEEVNRCSSGPIALASTVDEGPRLGGALCMCSSNNVAFALRWLGIETVEQTPIPIAQAKSRGRRAVQQESGK